MKQDPPYAGQQPVQGIEPIDVSRCQGEVIQHTPFRLAGPPRTVTRCDKAPYFIAVERKPPKGETEAGAMSLCLECAEIMTRQHPELARLFTLTGVK